MRCRFEVRTSVLDHLSDMCRGGLIHWKMTQRGLSGEAMLA